MSNLKRIVSLFLAVVLLIGALSSLASCSGNSTVIDNESTRLVLSTSELDGVFNPFYSSSAPDGSVVGMTQIGMLSSDKDGKVACGPDEACVVLTYESQYILEDGSIVTEEQLKADSKVANTRYRFVLKNGLKFSDGSPLTMRDVLFNLYVYLDPAYYGSSTIYSTEIVGLQEYRTQSKDKNEQDEFQKNFDSLADQRIDRLVELVEAVYDNHDDESISEQTLLQELGELIEDYKSFGEEGKIYGTVIDDYHLAQDYFLEDLKKNYNYARGTAEDIVFTDKNTGKEVRLTTDTEAFLYNMGYIKWVENEKTKEYYYDYSLGANSKNWTEQEAIDAIFNEYFPNKVNQVVPSLIELFSYFSFLEQEKHFDSLTEKITSISGIKYANKDGDVTVNGQVYPKTELAADGTVINNSNEVLEITIEKVDPKAIWNFGFTVAPMFYYSNEAEIEAFDYTSNFGVTFGSIEFQNDCIKDPDKIGVPVGAGPYKATTRDGNSSKVTAGTFKADNVVYFERNEHFMFPVTIKYVNYQVVSTKLMLDALYSGDVHFVEPACKKENITDIESRANEGFSSIKNMTNGYGYIGINAEKVPDINVRRAIMHAIDTELAVQYYLGYSHAITRPMTKASWAYPEEADEKGQYYTYDATGKTSEDLVKKAGYSKNGDGIYAKGNDVLKYTFTIAGDTADHPAYMALKNAAEILNARGFKIEVKTDINALKKLNNGDLTVWAAAWGAGVDPDMYQVYHIDSTAGSTANWGYRAIKNGGKYETELDIVERLSEKIDAAREILNTDDRAAIYADALDLVMELAVELPTYQRNDLYAYNTNIIDASSLTPPDELTPYNGPMSRIWEVSLKETN